MNRIS
jgi:5'-AMP-activated protein kinase, catalytic alpha subunit